MCELFNINFNANFNIVFQDNSLVHQLVNKYNFDNTCPVFRVLSISVDQWRRSILILCFLTVYSCIIFENKDIFLHNFSWYTYLFSLHVSADIVPIIKKTICIYVTIDTCYSVWMTVWYAGAYASAYHTAIHTE